MKKAIITGITGQDGSYLAELLLSKDYIVHGLRRRSSSFNTGRIDHLLDDQSSLPGGSSDLKLHYGDLTDGVKINTANVTAPAVKTGAASVSAAAPTRKSNVLENTPEVTKVSVGFENNRGNLPWPVDKATITSSFGRQNIEGANSDTFNGFNGLLKGKPDARLACQVINFRRLYC